MRTSRAAIVTLIAVIVFILSLMFSAPANAQDCSPYSTRSCDTISVTPNPSYCLNWDEAEGGLYNTGFTMVDPATNATTYNPRPFAIPNVPSYDPTLIDLIDGTLQLTSTKGINFDDATEARNNSALNNLALALPAGTSYRIEVDVHNLDFQDESNSFQQTGLIFGVDEDNYFKLVLINQPNGRGTTARLQLLGEIETNSGVQWIPNAAAFGSIIVGLNSKTITLALDFDHNNRRLSASYAIDGGTPRPLGNDVPSRLRVPNVILDGTELGGALSEPHYIVGVIVSQRNSGQSYTAQLDNFCVIRTDAEANTNDDDNRVTPNSDTLIPGVR